VVADQDLVPGDAELERLDHLRLEGVGLHPGAHRLSALELGLGARTDEDHVRMRDLDGGVEVSSVERPVGEAQTLNHPLVPAGHTPTLLSGR
jgi:hypothetical protein